MLISEFTINYYCNVIIINSAYYIGSPNCRILWLNSTCHNFGFGLSPILLKYVLNELRESFVVFMTLFVYGVGFILSCMRGHMDKRSLSIPPLCLGTLVHHLVLTSVVIVPCKLNVITFGVLYVSMCVFLLLCYLILHKFLIYFKKTKLTPEINIMNSKLINKMIVEWFSFKSISGKFVLIPLTWLPQELSRSALE